MGFRAIMQVYGLVGKTSEGIWLSAALRAICTFLSLTNQSVNLHIALKPMFYLLIMPLYKINRLFEQAHSRVKNNSYVWNDAPAHSICSCPAAKSP